MTTPTDIQTALDKGALLSISYSGGKDSQALLAAVGHLTDNVELVHADLGRAEWPQTESIVADVAAASGIPLFIVQRTKGDLVQRIEERLATLDGSKPFWPSAAQRYCTSDLKRDPIHKHLRGQVKDGIIISAQGLRAQESANRAKKNPITLCPRITSKKYKGLSVAEALAAFDGTGRIVINWLPIHAWKVEQVWEAIGHSAQELADRQSQYLCGDEAGALDGWTAHPAYVYGNERLSCALCVLASVGDLCNGRDHHPELYAHYVELEERTGFSFRHGFSLKDLPAKRPAQSQSLGACPCQGAF